MVNSSKVSANGQGIVTALDTLLSRFECEIAKPIKKDGRIDDPDDQPTVYATVRWGAMGNHRDREGST